MMSSLFFTAKFLPIAFPPTVKLEIIDEIINDAIVELKLNLFVK